MAVALIVGGGIAGLSAAWEAAGRGADVIVAEAQPRFGGKVRTERIGDYLVEHGPDSFVTFKPAALQLAEELGLGPQIIAVGEPRSVSLRVHGRMHPMPQGMGLVLPTRLRSLAGTRILTWPQKVRAAADLVLPRVLTEEDMAVGDLLRRRLGDGVVDRLVDPLLGGVYGAPVDQLSLDAVLPLLRTSESQHRSLLLASLAQGRAARKRGERPRSPFRSLTGGMGTLVDALVSALAERGVDLRSGAVVHRLDQGPAGIRAEFSSGERIRADMVVLACGPAAAAALVAPLAAEAAAALAAVPLGSTSSVTLGFDAEAFAVPLRSLGHGYLEAGPEPAPVSAVTISSAKWPGRAPLGKVLVRTFVPDRVGPLSEAPDDAILAAVVPHVSRVLGAAAPPHMQHVVRWRDAMPKYVVGHRRRAERVDAALPAGIAVAGSTLHGVGVPDCIADGRGVARRLLQV